MPYQISQDTHLWHEAFNSNVNMIQRKVCLFRCSHRPCLKRNHSVYLTSSSLIYAMLIILSFFRHTGCIWHCLQHLGFVLLWNSCHNKRTRDICEGKSPSGMGKLNHKQPKKYHFVCLWITCMSCPDFHWLAITQ